MAEREMVQCQVGDWVRFIRGGELSIAQVECFRWGIAYPYGREIVTTLGAVDESAVIERRAALAPERKGEPE